MSDENQYLEILVREHWQEVHSLLTAITRNTTIAEDLSQEVFLLAWRKNIQPGPGMRTWLRKVAKYLALNAMRKRRPLALDPAEVDRMVGPEAPADEAPFSDRLTALRSCLGELPEADSALLGAKYEHDESLATIAKTADQSVGYLKQRLFRLRRRLAECIKQRMIAVGNNDA